MLPLTHSVMWEYSKNAAVYKSGSALSPDTGSASALILDFPAPKIMRNTCLLLKPPILWFFFFRFFFMWTTFKVFIEFVTILLLFYVLLFWPRGMWDLSSLTRDQTCTLWTRRWRLNHWTARGVPSSLLKLSFLLFNKICLLSDFISGWSGVNWSFSLVAALSQEAQSALVHVLLALDSDVPNLIANPFVFPPLMPPLLYAWSYFVPSCNLSKILDQVTYLFHITHSAKHIVGS